MPIDHNPTRRKTVAELNELTPEEYTPEDMLMVWNSADNTTRKATPETLATISGTKGGFSFTGGFARRGSQIVSSTAAVNTWIPMDLDAVSQVANDAPWWPDAIPPNGIDLFGGSSLPYGVTRMFDFDQTWDTSGDADIYDADLQTGANGAYNTPVLGTRRGTLRFDELSTGTTNDIRVDMYVTPMVANTTLEIGLWFQPKRTLDGPNYGVAFPLTGSPMFFGTGTVGRQFLTRPTTSMYIADISDQFAYAIPVFKADNPIIVEPSSCLLQNLR